MTRVKPQSGCSLTFEKSDINNQVVGTITPPKNGPKKSVNIVIAYDRSYSMISAANPNGDEITKYYSKNDLAIQSVCIIANSLRPDDTLEIYTYDSIVECVLPRTAMNDKGKQDAIASIKRVEPRGCTELWNGMKAAMDAANKTCKELGDATVIMITDGEPSNSPASGEVESLKNYRIENNNNCPVHTFGIGYDIKSKLLADLTNDGEYGGSFFFIPDGSMMITAWVNYLANEKNIFGKSLKVVINGKTVNLGTVKYGQSKTFIFDFADLNKITSVEYECIIDKKNVNIKIPRDITINNASVKFEIVRMNIVKAMNDMLKFASIDIGKSQDILRSSVSNALELVDDHPIIEDMIGEIATGFQTQTSVQKWGMHYIRSLITGHNNREILNFKDPGLKIYDSDEISKSRTEIDTLAMATEIPQPSLKIPVYNGGYGATGSISQPATVTNDQFWSSYNNAQGGCFGGDGCVILKGGIFTRLKYLKKGDILENGGTIECVVIFYDCDTIIIDDGGLEITPWHPIKINGTWIFPNTRKIATHLKNEVVYNFIISEKEKRIMNINGIDCCTLGHGITGEVIGHEFYGTEKVIDDLKKFVTYKVGIIDMNKTNLLYDPSGNEITGYSPQ